jgi:hypothetical protein
MPKFGTTQHAQTCARRSQICFIGHEERHYFALPSRLKLASHNPGTTAVAPESKFVAELSQVTGKVIYKHCPI